jgi:hypothetical protein
MEDGIAMLLRPSEKRARMWSPQAGRFMQRDPIGYQDGMNLYNGYYVPQGMDANGKEAVNAGSDFGTISPDTPIGYSGRPKPDLFNGPSDPNQGITIPAGASLGGEIFAAIGVGQTWTICCRGGCRYRIPYLKVCIGLGAGLGLGPSYTPAKDCPPDSFYQQELSVGPVDISSTSGEDSGVEAGVSIGVGFDVSLKVCEYTRNGEPVNLGACD